MSQEPDTKEKWLFIASLVGMALAAAALILMLPWLLGSGNEKGIGVAAALAVLGIGCAAGTRRWKPATHRE